MTTCSVTRCEKPVQARGYCTNHYALWRKNGDPTKKTTRWDGHTKVDKVCSVDGCDKRSGKAGMCGMHRQRVSRHGDPSIVLPRRVGRSTPEKFWARLNVLGPTECWEFVGSKDSWGYGQLTYQGKLWKANRLAFFLTHGRLPEPMALHHCDNPPCCNPSHLYEGDGSQNMRDMYARGRGNRPTGDAHYMARDKPLPEQAAEIAAAYRAGGRLMRDIAVDFGVSTDTVRRIAKRMT